MIATVAKPATHRSGIGSVNYWYAPNPHLGTRSAAIEASRIAEQVSSGQPLAQEKGDRSLFIAMHACAYRLANRTHDRATPLPEREQWLARWQTIRNYIVEKNLGLVHSMVGRFHSGRIDGDDLLSEAMFGLVRAVDRYNPWRGYHFSTYACNVIIRALMRRCRTQTLYRGRFPTIEMESCDRPDHSDKDADLYLEGLRGVMKHNRGALSSVESTVLSKRFPTNNASPMTFREISKVVGLSRERIRQIEHSALLKLRTALLAEPLLRS